MADTDTDKGKTPDDRGRDVQLPRGNRFEIRHLATCRLTLPTSDPDAPEYTWGDSRDTEDRVPEQERDGKLVRIRDVARQPDPVVFMTRAQIERAGPLFWSLIQDQIDQGRMRATALP